MAVTDGDPVERRDETEKERIDRNLVELVSELRVALPGVQVLFAFLLVVPFNRRFVEVTGFQEKVYLATLLLTAAASALLIAPSVHHRLQFRRHQKERVVMVGSRLTLAGQAALGLAMTGAVVLVTDFVFDTPTTVLAGAGTGVLFVILWFVIPLRAR